VLGGLTNIFSCCKSVRQNYEDWLTVDKVTAIMKGEFLDRSVYLSEINRQKVLGVRPRYSKGLLFDLGVCAGQYIEEVGDPTQSMTQD